MSNATAREQLMLELVNRARLDPVGEAQRLALDLNQGLTPGTITATPKQPLAMNDTLISGSRAHSKWMLDVDVFDHTGVGSSSPGDRMSAAGYVFTGASMWGENIAWSGTTGTIDLNAAIQQHHDGLFRSPGHRTNILEADFREIGIGQETGRFLANGTDWSASMLTQNFASSGSSVFVSGVVHIDTDGDRFYDIGEGRGAVVARAGTVSTQSGVAGGYELALNNGTQVITLGGISLSLVLFDENVKIDLIDGTRVASNASLQLLSGATEARLLGIDPASLHGSANGERLIGNQAANLLKGNAGNDTLDGGLGADVLDGGLGADVLNGGDGVDTLSYAAASSGAGVLLYMLAANLNGGDAAGDTYTGIENVIGTSVNDRIYMDNGNNSVEGGGGVFDTAELYAGNDSYLGGAGYDYILAGAGNDVIEVGTGGSLIYGEADHDRITAMSGSNELSGGTGDDTVTGGTGQDVIFGGAGSDTLTGGDGGDFLFGETGNDTLRGGGGNDQVFGGSDQDQLFGDAGIDILDGGDGNDVLSDLGTGELSFLIGGAGNDTLIGTTGQDQMWGGTGSIDTGADMFQFRAGNGFDIIFDFQAGMGVVDQIRLLDFGLTSFAQLQAENRIGQAGANTQINLPGSGNVIFLMNTTATTLVADDFLFG